MLDSKLKLILTLTFILAGLGIVMGCFGAVNLAIGTKRIQDATSQLSGKANNTQVQQEMNAAVLAITEKWMPVSGTLMLANFLLCVVFLIAGLQT